jgi:cytochrome c-type biogenesis protein CcmH/NrfG
MNDIDYELIEHYFSGEMTPEEKAAFESRRQADPEFREMVATWSDVRHTLRQSLQADPKRDELIQTLQSNRHVFQEKARVVSIRRLMAAAASVAVLIASVMYWSPWKKDLVDQYSIEEMISPAERGSSKDSLAAQAAVQFNHRHYKETIITLDKLLAEQPGDAYARYYRGLSYYENDQPAQARHDLEAIYNGESVFKYDGAFFIALSYLKEKNTEKCKEWLSLIPASAENYDKAQELLGDL